MLRELIRLLKQFRIEKREEILKLKLIKGWLKDSNYEYASQLFQIFTEKNSDVVMEIETPNGIKLKIYRDIEGNVKEDRMTADEMMLGHR